MIVVGLMSGTSADGIDAAIIEVEGRPPDLQWTVRAHLTQPHPAGLRRRILDCCDPATSSVDRVCQLNVLLGQAFAQAALATITAAGLNMAQVDLIGCHGQTVWHIPTGPQASTLQLGEAAVIAEMTGIPVVSNFRARDMAAGGQGAPLVAYVDTLVLTHPTRVRAAQNIGGIANVTYLPPRGAPGAFAFDSGPGNLLLDDAMGRVSNGQASFDRDGAVAAQGQVNEDLLAHLLADPYLHQPPPKTTGREYWGGEFGTQLWNQAMAREMDAPALLATLTAFTARAIAQAYHAFLPHFPDEVLVSGGGVNNPTLMTALARALAPARVVTTAAVGLPPLAKEAVAFALLAYETWHGRPGNLLSATGARRSVVLGSITPAGAVAISNLMPASSGEAQTSTEARNEHTTQIDMLPTLEMVRLMNAEDARVADAVSTELPQIAAAIDAIAARMRQGGRLIYIGAGTSGRLGVLDAAECPPTFGTPPELVVALIAGGPEAITAAVEGAEDDMASGARDVAALHLQACDSLVAIAASGETPYVLGGMHAAQACGALVVSIACNRPSSLEQQADIAIAPLVGPEVITGSTRLKAGTSQKQVLNMISTGVMVRLGKTFGNLMVDVQPTNIKLRRRAARIVAEACAVPVEEAELTLAACDGNVKAAIVAMLAGISPAAALQWLERAGGVVRQALAAEGLGQADER